MKPSKPFPLVLSLLFISLVGCGRIDLTPSDQPSSSTASASSMATDSLGSSTSETATNEESSLVESSSKLEGNEVSVFVLAGQSNMEGSTYYDHGQDWLRKAMAKLELDPEPCFDGISEVQTSFYGYYPYNSWWGEPTPHCSNPSEPMAGRFLPTKVGMGNQDDLMGPEVGLSYVLKDKRKDEKPIFFIKCAFSGSCFEGQNPCWKTPSQGVSGELYDKLKTYTTNNLGLIKGMGYTPVIKALLWHQGESDTNNDSQAENYLNNLSSLVSTFREDFKDYGRGGNGANIDFVDALIYDGEVLRYNSVEKLNDNKIAFAAQSEHNFIINTSTHREGGLNLVIGGGSANSDVEGCYNIYHYITVDCVRLGMAYANVILENGMLD